MREPTKKQKQFINEYLIDLNATQAAIRAGYSKKNAFKIGSELLQKTTVQAFLDERLNDRAKRTEITQDRVIQELANIAFSNVTDYVNIQKDTIQKGAAAYERASVKLVDTTTLSEEKQRAIASIKETQSGTEIKLHDKVKALELIGKHLGLFTEKVNMTGDMDFNFTFDYGTDGDG